jgi:hypothetical protein
MEYIKTVTTDAAETAITFDDFYPYIWIRSFDEGCYVSPVPGIQAGGVDVAELPAGGIIMIHAQTESIYVKGAATIEVHAQMYDDCPWKGIAAGGSGGAVIEALSVTANGTYTAPSGVDGYSPITVDVQEQPWQPLEDGYSNFWFELTDDTLSPWLNFSAKTENAVIDWGDGSGEVALDTLTPTHTYSKAGKYVVKCKGVTGIAKIADETKPEYFGCLRYVELNDEVVTISTSAFQSCLELKQCLAPNVTNIGTYAFMYCAKLEELSLIASTVAGSATRFCFGLKRLSLANTEVLGQYNAQYCLSITALTLPSTLQSITASAINNCPSLSEIHCQATTPPTLGVNVFTFLPNDFIIYVPVGTGETYKAAAGWSTYADHILEEGQTPNRAMLSRLAKAVETDTDEDMR